MGAAPSAGRILPIHFAMRNRAEKTVMELGKSSVRKIVEVEASRGSEEQESNNGGPGDASLSKPGVKLVSGSWTRGPNTRPVRSHPSKIAKGG